MCLARLSGGAELVHRVYIVDMIIESFGCSCCCLSDLFGVIIGLRRAGSSGVVDVVVSDHLDAVNNGYQTCLVQLLGCAEMVHQM